MKRSIYLVVIGVITLICAAVGVYMHNFSDEEWGWGDKQVSYINETLDEIHSLDVVSNMMQLTVKAGDDYAIDCKYSEGYEPTYRLENGKLTIEQNNKVKWSMRNCTCEVVVTIPKNKTLEKMSIAADVGDVRIQDITCGTFDYEGDVANVDVENVVLNTVNAQSDVGDIEFNRCQFEQMTVKNDVGDVEVESSKDLTDYQMQLTADLGDVEVNGKEQGKEYKNENRSDKKLNISVATGDVDVHY